MVVINYQAETRSLKSEICLRLVLSPIRI